MLTRLLLLDSFYSFPPSAELGTVLGEMGGKDGDLGFISMLLALFAEEGQGSLWMGPLLGHLPASRSSSSLHSG